LHLLWVLQFAHWVLLTFFSKYKLYFTPACAHTYLPTHLPYYPWTYLPTYPPICLPTHEPTYLPTYLYTCTLNIHQSNNNSSQWGHCNILGRMFCCPSYLPNRPPQLHNYWKQCCNDPNEDIVIKLDFFSITL
jgi:hypothetical protein